MTCVERERLIRVNERLHSAIRVAAADLDESSATFVSNSIEGWLEDGGFYYPSAKKVKQILVPTTEDLDRKMRVQAAMEEGGVPVGDAYGSAAIYRLINLCSVEPPVLSAQAQSFIETIIQDSVAVG